MAWVSSGTVTVTNGNATVTGAGPDWFGAMQNGWGFVGPDGRVYEILTVDSADTVTLKTPYQGSTAAGQAYAVFPTGSHNLDLAAALQQLLSNYQGVYDTVGQGRFTGDIVFNADRDTGMACACYVSGTCVALEAMIVGAGTCWGLSHTGAVSRSLRVCPTHLPC